MPIDETLGSAPVITRRALLSFALGACASKGRLRETPFVEELLAAGEQFGETSRGEVDRGRRELHALAESVQESRGRGVGARQALINGVFEQHGFAREVEDTDLAYLFLPSVLERRRGSCVGLGVLFLALGELLELDVESVLRPGHLFVRVREASATHNVELLRRGEEMPDTWYEQRFPIPGGHATEYQRALSETEVLGVIAYDVGNVRRRQRRLREARAAYERATRSFPGLAEAHASLGAVLHLQGSLDLAEQAYSAARDVNPALPGVTQNLELLRKERLTR
jgi:tetratricopeptide (TPR) repeat protein